MGALKTYNELKQSAEGFNAVPNKINKVIITSKILIPKFLLGISSIVAYINDTLARVAQLSELKSEMHSRSPQLSL